MLKEIAITLQLSCLSEAMYFEARGEGIQGMKYVGAVVHNRVLDNRWSDDHCSVIEEPYQFTYMNGKGSAGNISMPTKEKRELAYRLADEIMDSEEPLYGNILYFHKVGSRPNWNFSLLETSILYKNHVFYTDK